MADSPTLNTDGPVTLILKLEGKEVPDSTLITSVQVVKEIGKIPEATITIETGSIPLNEFPDVDGATYKPGAEVEIGVSYGDNAVNTIFKGVLLRKALQVYGEVAEMRLDCRDKAHLMTIVPANGQYLQKKDSDIMSQIIGDAGLKAQVESTTTAVRDQLRHNARDWDYLRALADRNGQVVFVNDGEVKVAAPDTSVAPVLTLTLGVDILEMNTAVSASYMAEKAVATAWDDSEQVIVAGDGGTVKNPVFTNQTASDLAKAAGSQEFAFTTAANYEKDVLDAASKARLARTVLQTTQGTLKFIGSGKALPGVTLEIKGAGDVFGGNAYVGKVRQNIRAGEWTTEVTIGTDQTWRADEFSLSGSAAGALTTPMHGLHIGKVVKIIEDEDSRLRIQVNLPVHAGAETLVWARYATPYATTKAGVFFMPEIDDEVVIGFLSSDPDNPVVLGSLHNAATEQPYKPDEDNTYKAIVTRNELKVEFEDVKKIITISTPGGHIVTMDDDAVEVSIVDTTGNKVKMSSSGIDMSSPGDINISADGNIAIAATGDASVEGMNVEVTAQAQLTASGSAGAELSASGQTVVKGAMVMIN